ncbi:MAG: hypothetical protein ACQEXX_01625 [Bacillota bacterium]
MKLFYAHHEKYPEDFGVYAVEDSNELVEFLAKEENKDTDYIREHYIYGEMAQYTNEKTGKKYKVILEEV